MEREQQLAHGPFGQDPWAAYRQNDQPEPPRPRSTRTFPEFEVVVAKPQESFRWFVHSYPTELARWHYHHEYELHLIQRSSGKAFVGDYIGNFRPGALYLTGPNLPHNWVSDIDVGEHVRDRDMLIQFSDVLLRDLMRLYPEFLEMSSFLDEANRGIEFHGETATSGARRLCRIGNARGTRRVLLFLELIYELSQSPERKLLSSQDYAPTLDHGVSDTINRTIDFLIRNLAEDLRLSDVARHCGMSDSVFSRFFKKNTGHGFVRYVNRMRVNRVCMLLTETKTPVTEICFATGFNNLSNFNRQFLAFCGLTPSEYRRQAKRKLQGST